MAGRFDGKVRVAFLCSADAADIAGIDTVDGGAMA